MTIIAHQQIGGANHDTSIRTMGWGDPRDAGYWPKVIDTCIKPMIDAGVTRIMLHNPFGTLPGEAMQPDQYIGAIESQLTGAIGDNFTNAWRPITDQGVEVIAYLGKLMGDQDFEANLVPGRLDNWMWRAWLSYRAPLDAGMSIGFDAIGGHNSPPVGSPAYEFADFARALLRTVGHQAYIEPRPHKDATHLHDWPIITLERFWQRSDPERHSDSSWAARNDQLTGEIVRLGVQAPEGDAPEAYIERVIADGHTPAIPMWKWRRDPARLKRLVELAGGAS